MQNRAKALLQKIEKDRGQVKPWNKILAQHDPEFMEMWHNIDMSSLLREGALTRQEKEILCIVVDAVTDYEDGLRLHIRSALKMGVTEAEIVDALEVCTMLGVHYISAHIDPFEDEVAKFKKAPASAERPQRDPRFMEHWHNISAHALREERALPRKVKELVCVVIDALTFFEPGLRRHVKAALEQGASEQEVFEALELCSASGVQHLSRHIGVLQEEAQKIKPLNA